MPAFQAINLEPEENADDQIDTTKELHVDEALKRFQNALRLHAQGPASRAAAAEAYEELFRSEVFSYKEATTDYDRTDRQANGLPEVSAAESFSTDLDIAAGGADGVAASLSQALYLSYKNRGEFFLDKIKDSLRADTGSHKSRLSYHDAGQQVIDDWAAALDQDPSDPELWRKAARFAASMNSGRLKRFCLEAAIELDDDPTVMEVDPPSLAESLAGEQLKEHLRVLGDDTALSHPSMTPWLSKELPSLLRKHMDPMPWLPDPTKLLTPPPSSPRISDSAETIEKVAAIPEVPSTWSELGQGLMKCIEDTAAALRICESVLESAQDASSKQPIVEAPREMQTEKAPEELKKEDKQIPEEIVPKQPESPQKERNQSVAPRKRSQSAAGLQDAGDEENGTGTRSKRVRRRDTALAEETLDPITVVIKQLEPYQEADSNLFRMTKNMLDTLGVEDRQTFALLDEVLESCNTEERTTKFTSVAAQDIRHTITNFSNEVANVLLSKRERATLGLSSFLEHSKPTPNDEVQIATLDEKLGLAEFAKRMCDSRFFTTGQDIAFEWLLHMSESYGTQKWSDELKTTVVQMTRHADGILYERISTELATTSQRLLELTTLVPMLLELHIDIYERITNPSSVVYYATRVDTKYRLDRWLSMASHLFQVLDLPRDDPLCARFLWASVMAASHADNPGREHILLLWTSLRDHLVDDKIDAISLPNNAVMPSVSAADAEREIAKLTTMDFFLGLFQEEMESPLQVIETLEPVLNPSTVYVAPERGAGSESPESGTASQSDTLSQSGKPVAECAAQSLRDLWKFLLGSSTELRLFLWSRLGDAYQAIGYTTGRFSCTLRGIEMIANDLESESYITTADESRRLLFMRTLKSLDDLLIQGLSLSLNDKQAFDIIDEDHIKSSASALSRISSILHMASLCEDEIRIGLTTGPSGTTFQSLVSKLRDLQVRSWCLQFTIFKAGFPQQDSIIVPENELADYLGVVHRVIGLRKACKASNKIFLNMTRVELLKLKNVEHWENYLGQVLYDLYGLKLGVGFLEIEDHGCPHEDLDKAHAEQLVEKIIVLAKRMTMKDLLKSELKNTIEHVQNTMGTLKSQAQMMHNLRNFTEMLKKPIHPLRLYQALLGNAYVDTVSVKIKETALADDGWFFLYGMIAFTRFKGVDLNRRQTPGAIDDLRIGATFLRLQLQFTPGRWDAWFRLGETFDYELEEAVLWTADKMNKERAELVKFQRNAIHCYTLALSYSRYLDVDNFDGDSLHDFYHKFGMRLYSSSREPFAMEPFRHSDLERYFIENLGGETSKRILHEQMTEYKVWKFAAKLFRMAMERQPRNWKNPYMLAKCYWKMHCTPVELLDAKDRTTQVSVASVIQILRKSIEVLASARKSRHSEPVLEPHYKIASVVHKMVLRGDLSAAEAATILKEQPLGVPVKTEDSFASFEEPKQWQDYIMRSLTKLKDKDKANWQHRIIMRQAKVLFGKDSSHQDRDEISRANASFTVLRDSSMFTKTMVMNVWKCDAERPGRHHVYTEQYMRFMTSLLVILSDRVNLEAVLRRLRKKGADFYHFADLWQSCCLAYVKLLRQSYSIQQTADDPFKAMSLEEFEIVSERIADWAASEGPHTSAFDCLKDTVELKKLNANLMKAGAIDDLITDCFARTYLEIAGTLPGIAPSKVIEERNHAKQLAAKLESGGATPMDSSGEPRFIPLQENTAGTSTPQDAERTETAPRPRRTGVRRPDILRKAEQAVVRAIEAPLKSAAKGRVGSISSGKRGSQTPRAAASANASSDEDEDGPDAQVRREAGEADVTMADGDGHIRNMANDDDSDLSDLPEDSDDEVPEGLRFPNLPRPQPRIESSGEEADSEDEGDEEVEERSEGGDSKMALDMVETYRVVDQEALRGDEGLARHSVEEATKEHGEDEDEEEGDEDLTTAHEEGGDEEETNTALENEEEDDEEEEEEEDEVGEDEVGEDEVGEDEVGEEAAEGGVLESDEGDAEQAEEAEGETVEGELEDEEEDEEDEEEEGEEGDEEEAEEDEDEEEDGEDEDDEEGDGADEAEEAAEEEEEVHDAAGGEAEDVEMGEAE